MTSDLTARIESLEGKVAELEALVGLALRLLAVDQPVSALLRRYGATESQETAVMALLDDVSARAERGGMYSPSFSGFVNDLFARFPGVRNNREFVALLIDALKLDRPAYQKLHNYGTASNWPSW